MRTGDIAAAIVAAALVAAAGPAGAQGLAPAAQTPEDGAGDGGFGLHYQVGAMIRVATNVHGERKQNYLVTGDLVGLTWSRTESTWGAGLHFAFDDSGHRLGVKGLWRRPLSPVNWSYLQFAGGVYVSETDDAYDLDLPGFFLEVELGLAKEFALTLAGEVLPYKNRVVGVRRGSSAYDWERITEDGTATAVFIGGRVGQVGGVAVTVLGLIAGAAVLASFASSGGIM